MSEVALITDTHCGVRDSSILFESNQEQFYTNIFFPALLKRGIKTIYHLGDYFDRRKYINFRNLAKNREMFLDKLVEHDITMYVIAGNHDIYYKNTSDINSPELLFKGYENNVVVIWDNCITHDIDNTTVTLIPWINEENIDKLLAQVDTANPDILMGHFEFAGFEMHRGAIIDQGMKPSVVADIPLVLSGHYHHKSRKGNIQYLGAPFEYTWSDHDDPRGFHILESGTKNLEFIKNPFVMFHKIEYNDKNGAPVFEDMQYIKDKYVKIVATNKDDLYTFDRYISHVDSFSPFDLQVIDLAIDSTDSMLSDEEIAERTKDTKSFLSDYVDSLDYVGKDLRGETKELLEKLYTTALYGS